LPNRIPLFEFDTGEQVIYGYWQPGNDPETVSAELIQLANASDDWTVPLMEAKQAVIYDTEQHFAREEDPEGDDWEPLNEEYLHSKTKTESEHPNEILKLTGEMYNAATSQDSWIVTDREIVFNAEHLPFYGAAHQEGAYSAKRIRRKAAEHGVQTALKLGKGLPRREFIGISDECADEIQVIFGRWIDGLTEEIIGGPGPGPTRPPIAGDFVTTSAGFSGSLTNVPAIGGGFMVRGVGGRFVKGVFRSII